MIKEPEDEEFERIEREQAKGWREDETDDLLDKIHKYDETLYMSTVIGVLELVKQQLINDSLEDAND